MLALKDSDHVVRFNAFGLARRANMPEEEVLEALAILESPDVGRIEAQPHEGRRIRRVADGWLILNGQVYEDMMRRLNRREYQRVKKAEYRAKAKGGTAAERAYEKAYGDGVVKEQPVPYVI